MQDADDGDNPADTRIPAALSIDATTPPAEAAGMPLTGIEMTLPPELLCAVLEHVGPLWLPVAARVSTVWYDCAVAVGGVWATVITARLVDEAILTGAVDVALWCLEALACPWTERRALLAAIAHRDLAERMGGTGARSPVTAIVALVQPDVGTGQGALPIVCANHSEANPKDDRAARDNAREAHSRCNGGDDVGDDHDGDDDDTCPSMATRLRRLERCGYRWDDATLACAAVTAGIKDFETLAVAHPAGLGMAWVVASALGRIDLLDLLGRRWMRAAPAGACLHVAHPVARAWMASNGQWPRDTAGVHTSGWRSWADPPEDALAVWVAQRGEAFDNDPCGHLAAALLGVEYVADDGSPLRMRIGRMVLTGRPSYERGPYLSESARMARETMRKVDDILRETHAHRDEAPTRHRAHQMR
ncbi:hypothetical protein pdul_cds_1003 [Pandoravirus dulcis]|uniref:F-box incomplete domain containing protein n=1 Tax=Pandoravirus dulcis TaxID=1349409 RepID=S4VS87_9VIRU|nr:hypothetical protein pdul_cds_1003 [Pandoravirus dulcis]AGO83268.1 hypothetical protein pdul_cds_1003 [Pandoravirus dulcis]